MVIAGGEEDGGNGLGKWRGEDVRRERVSWVRTRRGGGGDGMGRGMAVVKDDGVGTGSHAIQVLVRKNGGYHITALRVDPRI